MDDFSVQPVEASATPAFATQKANMSTKCLNDGSSRRGLRLAGIAFCWLALSGCHGTGEGDSSGLPDKWNTPFPTSNAAGTSIRVSPFLFSCVEPDGRTRFHGSITVENEGAEATLGLNFAATVLVGRDVQICSPTVEVLSDPAAPNPAVIAPYDYRLYPFACGVDLGQVPGWNGWFGTRVRAHAVIDNHVGFLGVPMGPKPEAYILDHSEPCDRRETAFWVCTNTPEDVATWDEAAWPSGISPNAPFPGDIKHWYPGAFYWATRDVDSGRSWSQISADRTDTNPYFRLARQYIATTLRLVATGTAAQSLPRTPT